MYNRKSLLHLLFLLGNSVVMFGQTNDKVFFKMTEAPIIAVPATIGTFLSNADVALCKSVLTPNILKGNIGENVAANYFMKSYLAETGNWQSVTPRLGPQGIDHIFVKYDRNNIPRKLMLGETKYGSSRLGNTRDGIQLGSKWNAPRLIALSNCYYSAAQAENLEIKTAPLNPRYQLAVPLKNGQKVLFWREKNDSQWKYGGSADTLIEGRKQILQTGKLIEAVGKGNIDYSRRLFNVSVDGNDLKIVIRDANTLNVHSDIKKLTVLSERTIRVENAGKYINHPAMRDDLARTLQSKYGHLSDKECREYADKICRNKSLNDLLQASPNPWLSASGHMAIAATAGALIDFSIQLLTKDEIDLGHIAFTGSVTAVGVGIGEGMQMLLVRSTRARTMASLVGVNSIFARSLLASGTAGLITSALFAYGGWGLGYTDLETANRMCIAGGVGSLAGVAAIYGTMSLIATFGTASTGTAISSLGGAAATNATMAWLGGGSLAAGGSGTAVGAVILSGGVLIVAGAVTGAVMYYFVWKDEKDKDKRTAYMLTVFSDKSEMSKIIDNHYTISKFRI